MKVICVGNKKPNISSKYSCLTIGKIYDLDEYHNLESINFYTLVNDHNEKASYRKYNFKLLNEYRLEKLEMIGI